MSKIADYINRFKAIREAAKKKMNDVAWRVQSNYPIYYDTLPIIPKTILLESEHGKVFNGIIFQLTLHLATMTCYQDYTIIVSGWESRIPIFKEKLARYGVNNVQFCAYRSDSYFRVLASAQYLINDTSFIPCFIKKEGQVYLNTWHGTPLKTLGKSVVGQQHAIGNIQKNFLMANYLLMPNVLTDQALREDYMLDNLATGKRLFGGYPRNTVFFLPSDVTEIREELGLTDKRVYAYLPTYRGTIDAGKTGKSDIYLLHYFYQLDKLLSDDECLLVNLHPLAKSSVNFDEFKHIRAFPENRETYDVLTASDLLITDYSSVFFDFACSRKKIILFTYDKEEYLRDRGMYFSMDTLPFPQVSTPEALLQECRTPKNYDDKAFLKTYCRYEGADATEKLCRHVILGEKCLKEKAFPTNGKKNVLIYAGNLAQNGITTALLNLLNSIDLTRRNYIVLADFAKVSRYASTLLRLPAGTTYLLHHGEMNMTLPEFRWNTLFRLRLLSAKRFVRRIKRRFEQDTLRTIVSPRIDTVIQFNGYEDDVLLWLSTFKCRRMVYAHSDMCHEIAMKGNSRKDVLQYVYDTVNHVVAVTPDLMASTQSLTSTGRTIDVVRNMICYREILAKSTDAPAFDSDTVSTHSLEQIEEILANASRKKLVSVGRFAPEKGHLRLLDAFKRVVSKEPTAILFIIGGYSLQDWYERTVNHIAALGLQDNVVLIRKVSNPFPFVKACDGFVLSSFYEGFGLVLAEADILGLPVISTDITGPRLFMQEHGGTLVANNEDGLYEGMLKLLNDEIKPINVDYEAYNRVNVRAFENLFKEKKRKGERI